VSKEGRLELTYPVPGPIWSNIINSTVSKVLRHKEKYLCPEDRSNSPIKRSKGKGVDIEKALTNFLRNAQKTGMAVTGDDLKEKARLFSTTMGSSGDSYAKTNSTAWLDKFMLKHGIGPGKLMRRASETNIPDSIRGSPSLTSSQPSSAISPASPSAHLSPSPLSANRSDEEKENMNSFMDFTTESNAYKHSNSQSTTSLSSAFTDTAASSFSGSALSPTASFSFSPDPNVGGFLTADQSRQLPSHGGSASNFQRPRSQTFPTLDLEYMNQPQTTEPLTPKYHVSSTAPPSAIESAASEPAASHFGLDHTVASPQLRHSSSNSSITARTSTTPVTTSAVSSPSSPTQEDARRAADTLLSFIQNVGGLVDRDEYMAVVRLTEKLRIHQNQLAKAATHGMGGLSRIPEGDSEMPNAPPPGGMIKTEQTMGA
jgi:Tc5 transposase DNA-binding domain